MFVGFVTTPFFIRHLGASAYGVYVLVLVFTTNGYLGYLDLGIQAAIVQRGAGYAALGRWRDFRRVVGSGLVLLAAIGAAAAALLLLAAQPLSEVVFNLPAQYESDFRIALFVLAAVLVVQFPGMAILSALLAVQRPAVVAGQRSAAAIVGVLVAVGAVAVTDSLLGLLIPIICAPLLGVAAAVFVARARVPNIARSVYDVNASELRGLLRLALVLFSAQAGVVVIANFDQVVIGIALNTRAVALYGIAATVYYAVFALAAVTNSSVFSTASHLVARGELEATRRLFIRGTCVAASIVLAGATTAEVWGPTFIRDWVGPGFAESGVLLQLWLVHFVVTAFVGIGWSVLPAMGRVRLAAWFGVASAAINVVATLAAVGPWGIRGVVAGTVIAYLVTGAPMLIAFLRVFDISARSFASSTVFPAFSVALCTVSVGVLLRTAVQGALAVTTLCAGATFLIGLAATSALLTRSERLRVRRALRLRVG